jgi:hypothetical protein
MSARLALRLLALGLWMAPVAVRAQSVVTGVVRDSTGAAIAGAAVAITALNRSAETDATGRFRLENVLAGMRMLSVRRIGYSPFSKLIAVADGENAVAPIVLGRVITKLDTVVTEEQMLWREDPLLREMADNMKLGLGHFVLRPELDKLTGMHVHIAFENRTGLMVLTSAGGDAWIASSRGPKSFTGQCYRLEGNVPGSDCSHCFPRVYLDNQPLSIRPNEVPSVDEFLPETLEAIEIYTSPAQTPARYNTLNAQCGVVVLHSRKYVRKPK